MSFLSTSTLATSTSTTSISSLLPDDSAESYDPYSWASNGENVDSFPVFGRRRKRAVATYYDSQAEYSSNYDTYPDCDSQDGSDSSSYIGTPVDYGGQIIIS